ncbi:MAG: MFS transporter [Phycisphaerales bacterium]|nr:MFS transporter [Phycisphaerales bacterium]
MKLHRLNPFAGLPNPKEVWAWGMYDLANQSFTLLIITLLFPIYLKKIVIAQGSSDPALLAAGDAVWARAQGGSLFLVVLISPLIGALSDARGLRKEVLIGSGLLCAALTCVLALAGPGDAWLAVAAFAIANIGFQLGENFLASFLPDLSTRKSMGRISALGWAMGYSGAVTLLVLTAVIFAIFGWKSEAQWRPMFVIAGLWFLFGMIPAIRLLRDDRKPASPPTGSIWTQSFGRLTETLSHATRYRQLVLFLAGFLIYAFGVQTVIAFASILAEEFGFKQSKLVLFVLQISATGAVAAIATAAFTGRLGAKRTVIAYLLVWIVSCTALAWLSMSRSRGGWSPEWMFWLIGNGLGFGLGGIGTATRALVGAFTPKHRSAEFFGLWGLTFKLAGAIGVLTFGEIKAGIGTTAALWTLTGFFVIGLAVVMFVNERAGRLAARNAERETARVF